MNVTVNRQCESNVCKTALSHKERQHGVFIESRQMRQLMFGAKGHILVSLVDGAAFSDDMFPFFLGVSVADPDPFDTDPDPAF
jgi:hypothetical protein